MTKSHSRRVRESPPAVVHGVKISSPTRVLYPVLGLTKIDVVQFYADISRWLLPHVRGRPLTLVRCEPGPSKPDALRSECQFLRHSSGWHRWVPASVHREMIVEQHKQGEYLVIESEADLLSIINGDILELHTWNATIRQLEQPDRLVFDLDPAADVPWSDVVAAALSLRARLQKRGLHSWVKTTGGKGLHVCVPLEPVAGWDVCFAFSRMIADELVRESPSTFTTTYGRASRAGKILIDYKRNHRAAVAITAFSTRARALGTVSVPFTWEAIASEPRPDRLTVLNVRDHLRTLRRDPWHDYWKRRQTLRS
jgi:bifunctional non-homologous end joining protein LigD